MVAACNEFSNLIVGLLIGSSFGSAVTAVLIMKLGKESQ